MFKIKIGKLLEVNNTKTKNLREKINNFNRSIFNLQTESSTRKMGQIQILSKAGLMAFSNCSTQIARNWKAMSALIELA
jgi:hypothetical protein